MVTYDEYVRAIRRPIQITSRDLRYATLRMASARDTDRPNHKTGPPESIEKLNADRLAGLAFRHWLRANEIRPLQATFRSVNDEDDRGNAFIVNDRRVRISADLRDWREICSLPANKCELCLPIDRITNTALMADYYVYCFIDRTFTRAAMIGYYECYALSSPDKKHTTCLRPANISIARLHPMSDLTLILKMVSESDSKMTMAEYMSC